MCVLIAALEEQERQNYTNTSLVHVKQILMDIGTESVLCINSLCVCLSVLFVYMYNYGVYLCLCSVYSLYVYSICIYSVYVCICVCVLVYSVKQEVKLLSIFFIDHLPSILPICTCICM